MKMSIDHWWNGTDWRKESTGRETCRNATLSITNIKWTGLGSNAILHDVRLAAIDLSRVTTN